VTHVSNALGTVNPARDIIEIAHRAGVPVLIDGRRPWRTCDRRTGARLRFSTVSRHKVFGPTGIGALYGRLPLLEAMPPYQGGGDMIESVTFEKTTYNEVPHQVRGRHAQHLGAVGLGARSTTAADRPRVDEPLRARAAEVCDVRASRESTGCASSAPRGRSPASSRS